MGMDRFVSHSNLLQPIGVVLGHHQPCHAGIPSFLSCMSSLLQSLHVIHTGSFYGRRDLVRGKAILEICCYQLSPACAR